MIGLTPGQRAVARDAAGTHRGTVQAVCLAAYPNVTLQLDDDTICTYPADEVLPDGPRPETPPA